MLTDDKGKRDDADRKDSEKHLSGGAQSQRRRSSLSQFFHQPPDCPIPTLPIIARMLDCLHIRRFRLVMLMIIFLWKNSKCMKI